MCVWGGEGGQHYKPSVVGGRLRNKNLAGAVAEMAGLPRPPAAPPPLINNDWPLMQT